MVVELAQNAADAALRAGEPGSVLFRLGRRRLVVANTGAPLDRAGVEALSTLRASAKRDGTATAGRFGVGFAAVRSVSDEPLIASTSGAVRWSLADARSIAGSVGSLAGELDRRGGDVPLLRLPFSADLAPVPGYVTAVVLPLRDDAAEAAVRAELAGLDPTLLLALPALAAVTVEVDSRLRRLTARGEGAAVVVEDDGEVTRWHVVRRTGRVDPALVADRPVEERARTGWAVMCAVPVGSDGAPQPLPGSVPAVVRAPTPTDDPLSLPAVVTATWPLDSTRRRVATGPLRAALVEAAAGAYADVVREVATTPAVLDLVPVGLAAGELDAALRATALDRLADTAFLPLAEDPQLRVRPREALALDLGPTAVEVMAPVLAGLLPEPWARRLAPLAVLGVRRIGPAELVDALAALDREPAWWRSLYAALAETHLGAPERDALGALPVPLADGRLVSGPRGLLLPGDDVPAEAAGALGLRLVHPDAAHPLLRLLGATDASPRTLLDDPRLQAAVAASYDAEDPSPLADAVLRLVAAGGLRPGELPQLADLALPADDGELYPAGELLLPGSPLAEVVDPDAPFGRVAAALVERWGPDVLSAVGVLDRFAVLRRADVPVDPAAADSDLDGEDEWFADVLSALPEQPAPPVLAELVAVRDLELVADWARALPLLPRDALAQPALAVLADGRRVEIPSYTRWWLARAPVIGGRRPRDLALAGSDLGGLYDAAPVGLDADVLALLGVRSSVEALLAEPDGAAELLDRLGDPARDVGRDAARTLHALLAAYDAPPPDRVRAVRGGRLQVVDAGDAVVVDAPDLLPLVAPLAVVPAPLPSAGPVADLLDVPLAGELTAYDVVSSGVERSTPRGAYVEHERLLVTDAAGRPTPVAWRVVGDTAHVDAAAGPEGIARALAWREGRWADRWLLAALLRAPLDETALLAEHDLD